MPRSVLLLFLPKFDVIYDLFKLGAYAWTTTTATRTPLNNGPLNNGPLNNGLHALLMRLAHFFAVLVLTAGRENLMKLFIFFPNNHTVHIIEFYSWKVNTHLPLRTTWSYRDILTNGKRRAKICVLPKVEEIELV